MTQRATTPADSAVRRQRWQIAAWALLLLAMATLHIGMLWARPLHINTLYTGGKMLLGWGALWEDLQTNAFPPLYYLLARAWAALAGTGPAPLLLPSLLFTLASAPALAWAIRPWVPDFRVRLLAGALAGLHAYAVLFGSGLAKPYAAMWLAMILGAGWYIRCADAALAGVRAAPSARWGFGAACVVASQLHFPGIALPLVALIHAVMLRARLGLGAALLRRVALVVGVSVGLYALWTGRIATRLGERAGMDWITEVPLDHLAQRVLSDWQWLWSGSIRPSALPPDSFERAIGWLGAGVGVAMLGALAAALFRRPGDPRIASARWLLALWILVPLLGVAAIDRMHPLYHPRYVGTALFPAAVLAARCVEWLWRRGRRVLATAALALLLVGRAAGLESLGTLPILRDWLGLYRAGLVEARAKHASLVLILGADWSEIMMRYIEHLDGPTPEETRVVWLGDRTRKDDGTVSELLAGHERVLAVGFPKPPRVFAIDGGWKETGFDGYWYDYSLVSGRKGKHHNHRLFERVAPR